MNKKLLGVSLLIGLAVTGCKTGSPKFPVIKICRYIVGEPRSKDILYCTLSNGNTEWEEIIKVKDIPKVPATDKEVVVCTTLNNLKALKIYKDNMERWINNNCR